MTPSRPLLLALIVPVAFLAAGCGDATVSASTVESQIKSELAPKLPQPVADVSCPGDLKAKVGKTENCVLTYESGDKVQVRATVTKVTDSKASFDLLVTKRVS